MGAQLIPVVFFAPVMIGLAYLRILRARESRRRSYRVQGQRIRVRLDIAERAADSVMRHAA